MRLRFLLIFAVAFAFTSVAFADIVINFSSPVNTVSFYSSEPYSLTATTNGTSPLNMTVLSGYTLGAVTPFADTNVTRVDFSGTPDFYVLDDFTYMVGGNAYVLNFDAAQLVGHSVGNFYAGMPGAPVFSPGADVLTYPNYNYPGYPYESFPSVVYEGGIINNPTPEPSTFIMLGSGILGLAGVVRRKVSL